MGTAMSLALLAQEETPSSLPLLPFAGLFVAGVVVLIFAVLLLLLKRYKRCPSNKIMVVSGKMGGNPSGFRCYHGGGCLVLPFFQESQYLSLEPIQIEIPLNDVFTSGTLPQTSHSVFTVAIGTRPETMYNAALRLLGLTREEINYQASKIILGHLREARSSMWVEEINQDLERYFPDIKSSLEPALQKLGLVLLNANLVTKGVAASTQSTEDLKTNIKA